MEVEDCITKGYDMELCDYWADWDHAMEGTARAVKEGKYGFAEASSSGLIPIDERIIARVNSLKSNFWYGNPYDWRYQAKKIEEQQKVKSYLEEKNEAAREKLNLPPKVKRLD